MDDGNANAAREKRRVAISSVAAAVLLTCMKLVAGLATGSLGLLAEAAHSGLDLIAAVITCLAVRASDAPADEEHHYGHGKIENLSALAETGLLLLTCGWIAYEAAARLFFQHVPVDATPWAFLVILISIAVDVSRSRALARVAKKHGSQALEADALHFSSDVWSSAVVMLGLVLVKVGQATGWWAEALARADAAASMVVAVLVVVACGRLGRRAVDALLDHAPAGDAGRARRAAEKVAGVLGCPQVRLRRAGNRTFIDMVIGVRRCATAESSHAVGHAAADRVAALLPGADVVVHVDPQRTADETPAERVRAIAANMGQAVHAVTVTEGVDGRLRVELHAEAGEEQSLREAHRRASELEAAIAAEMPDVASVTVSIEPECAQALARCAGAEAEAVVRRARQIAATAAGVVGCHDIAVQRTSGGFCLTMHCVFPAEMSVGQVHSTVAVLGDRLHAAVPGLARVTIHPEPDPD